MSAERVHTEDSREKGRPLFVVQHGPIESDAGPRHASTHVHAVLAFHLAGTARIEQAGEWSLEEGDVLLIPAGAPHRHLAARQSTALCVGFCPVCFLADEASEGLVSPFEHVRAGASAVVKIPEARRPFLRGLLEELKREVEREGGGVFAIERSLLTLILAEVARAASWGGKAGASDSVVTEALRFIERHCLESISPRDVAAAVHRSPAHLTTAVRQATGRSVQEWLIAGRLSEARRRLLHTDEIIAVIAERVGYADATHFIRLFRRAHGETPAAWRTRYRHAPVAEEVSRRSTGARSHGMHPSPSRGTD
ncbi:MAG: AraC family transcriptional regulator [Cystobacter sp.]